MVPKEWMPPCQIKGVISHWTAGNHHASRVDREHYHLLIEGDGRLVRGEHSITDNLSTGDDDYAAHTRGANTGRIGVAICAQAEAIEHPYYKGPYPVTQKQWETLVAVNAALCSRYQIPVDRTTTLFHGEVERYLGIPQRGKWDVFAYHLFPGKTRWEIGDIFRDGIRHHLTNPRPASSEYPVNLTVAGTLVSEDAYVTQGVSFIPVRAAAEAVGATLLTASGDRVSIASTRIKNSRGTMAIPLVNRGGVGYVKTADFREALNLKATWNGPARTVDLDKPV